MQCRSYIRRRTIECLFVTACSMDQYAEQKRTEKNLIVRSISEAETTNNKRLRSRFCIEANKLYGHEAASLRQRASCLQLHGFKLTATTSDARRSFAVFL